MSDRRAQEFWDQMWYWERYEQFPGETFDDPHLVISLGRQVSAAVNAGRTPDPDVSRRFDACVGRILDRLTNAFPRSAESLDNTELRSWLKFGLDHNHRGHDGVPVPIVDADSLVIFLEFCGYARDFCNRHNLSELGDLWLQIEATANDVEDERQRSGVSPVTSRFVPRR
jgi:hypothetical protein